MAVQVTTRLEVARFTAAAVAAVPALLSPLVTIPPGYAGLLKHVQLTLDVLLPSPSGTTYEARLRLNGAVVSVATLPFTEVVGPMLVELDVRPEVPVADGDVLDVLVVPTYAPAGVVTWTDVCHNATLELQSVQPACAPTDATSASLTQEDFLALLATTVDSTYLQPLQSAGEGNGFEVYTQAVEQLVRVSEAIERTLGAMFIDGFSNQVTAEAHGGRQACVPLLFTRTKHADRLMVLLPTLRVFEQEVDADYPAGVSVLVDREYYPSPSLVFNPGEAWSVYASALAERVGYGYNNPPPETLTYIGQPGSGLSNDGASVVFTGNALSVVAKNEPDTFSPNHVGQYVQFLSGANAGRTALATGYTRPDLTATPPTGGALQLMRAFVVRCPVWGPALRFTVGEKVVQPLTGAHGTVLAQSGIEPYFTVSIWVADGNFTIGAGQTLLGLSSGAFASLDPTVFPDVELVESDVWVPETGTAEWSMMDWAADWGVTVTNPVSPSGGRAAFLDTLGRERNVERLTGEQDEDYRRRIREIADVVSPHAIQRACVRVLQPYELHATVREIGTDLFPGLFYDAEATYAPQWAFAYDMDFIARPQDRFRLYVDGLEMRAFFLIEVERSDLGEFGFAYDDHPFGAFDSSPYLSFFDGYPVTYAAIMKRLWDTIAERKACGVGYDFVQEAV